MYCTGYIISCILYAYIIIIIFVCLLKCIFPSIYLFIALENQKAILRNEIKSTYHANIPEAQDEPDVEYPNVILIIY